MANLKPATNITAAGVFMAITTMLLQTLQANMINVPDSVMQGLPGIVAVVVPYLWDLWTGDNVKPPAEQDPAK